MPFTCVTSLQGDRPRRPSQCPSGRPLQPAITGRGGKRDPAGLSFACPTGRRAIIVGANYGNKKGLRLSRGEGRRQAALTRVFRTLVKVDDTPAGVEWERSVRFTKEFKLERSGYLSAARSRAAQLALELGVARNQLYKWQAQLRKKGEEQAYSSPGMIWYRVGADVDKPMAPQR